MVENNFRLEVPDAPSNGLGQPVRQFAPPWVPRCGCYSLSRLGRSVSGRREIGCLEADSDRTRWVVSLQWIWRGGDAWI